MASGPITSCQIEEVTDFLFLDSKITEDGDYSHEIRRQLLFGRKAMTDLDSVLKSRDVTLLTHVCMVEAMVFPVAMYSYASGAVRRQSAKELMRIVVLEKISESPLDSREIKL